MGEVWAGGVHWVGVTCLDIDIDSSVMIHDRISEIYIDGPI